MSEDTQNEAEVSKAEEEEKVEAGAGDSPEASAGESSEANAGGSSEANAGDSPEASAGESSEANAGGSSEAESADSAKSGDAPGDEKKFDKLKKAQAIVGEESSRSRGEEEELFEKVVFINRCAKVVKGGRRFSFSALVVTGDRAGKVGFGFGKAQEVSECIKKASEAAKKAMVSVELGPNTIPHPVVGRHGGGKVLLLPASPGTGLIAGGGVRAVVEAAGVKDVLAKSMGSNNHANVVKATLDALHQLRSKEEIYSARGKRVPEKRSL